MRKLFMAAAVATAGFTQTAAAEDITVGVSCEAGLGVLPQNLEWLNGDAKRRHELATLLVLIRHLQYLGP